MRGVAEEDVCRDDHRPVAPALWIYEATETPAGS
jgi:hypothetical protein